MDPLLALLVGAVLLFLPQLLLALVAVLDYSSRDSLKILFTQPALILLPVFTPFTFSRISRADNRVKLSVPLTYINNGITFAGHACILTYLFKFAIIASAADTFAGCTVLFFCSVCSTDITLYSRGLSPCCNTVSHCEISVFEPAQPGKHFVLNNAGDIVEKTNNDEQAKNEEQLSVDSEVKSIRMLKV